MNINERAQFSFGNSMKGKILSLLTLFLSFSVNAQVKITVFDQDLKPLSGVVLQSENPSFELVSKTDGLFQLDAEFVERLTLSHVSFKTQIIENLESGNYRFVLSPKITSLGQVEVEAFDNARSLKSVAGAVRKVSVAELNRFDQQSIVRPLNLTPGLRFEERAGASYRVSIRGSSLRSPFGVRNVKVYWNGIPFTDPGGNTYLNLLDRQNMNAIEVIKGPAGSMFGAGTGGVMKFKSTDYSSISNSIGAEMSFGSFGLLRYALNANTTGEQSAWTVKFAHHETDGYRDHNAMHKNVLELDGLVFSSEKQTIETSFIYSDLNYQIPGGLNETQFTNDPTQARPGSAVQNSSIDHQMFLFKLGQDYQINERFSNDTQFFGSYRKFENPFILDYKQDEESRFGFRSVFRYDSKNKFSASAGIEYQTANLDAKNYGNVGGERDTIRFADEIVNNDLVAFVKGEYQINRTWLLEAGLSLANTVYDINRTVDRINNTPQAFKKTFDVSLNPRIAINKEINENLSAHFSVSTGYSVPTTLEVRTNEGSLNTALQPERGINYEFNLRGGNKGISYDLSLFRFDLTESITTYTNPDGVVLFRNAGSLKQQGVELEVLKPWIQNGEGFVRGMSSRLAFTFHDFQFNEYQSGGDDFSGNDLTGTAPIVVGLTTDVQFRQGIYLNLSYLYTDPIPLNDENAVYADAYTMLFAKIGWARTFGKSDVQLSLAVDNILDQQYSLGNDLNAFGGRYYQPAPTRNYSVNLNLRLRK